MKKSPKSERLGYKSFYRRNLPHIQPVDADLFVTFRLAGSLPKKVLAQMAEERRWREEIQRRIDHPRSPNCQTWLAGILQFWRSTSTPPKLARPGSQIVASPISFLQGCITVMVKSTGLTLFLSCRIMFIPFLDR